MKKILQRAPLFAVIYGTLLIMFFITQFSETLQIYFPYFAVQGDTILAETELFADTIQQAFVNPRKEANTVVMGEDSQNIALPDTTASGASEVLSVMDEPTPTPVYGEPLEDIIAASQPASTYVEQPVDQSYFNDAVFLGDSRTVGLQLYSGWDNCDYLADVGMTIYDCLDRDISFGDIQHTTAREVLSTSRYGKVYIMLGINECGSNINTYFDKYTEVVDQIHRWQPDAIIVVQGIMKVGAQKSATHPSINNANITARNEKLATLANDWYIYYLDINEAVCDENGNLTDGYSFDQVHLYAKYYSLWCDYLLEHGFVFNGVRR
ncbi:MAG: lipase [Lachnospiraceae bacterium]|nr:lipase [Lachnospiraceae bacterium]